MKNLQSVILLILLTGCDHTVKKDKTEDLVSPEATEVKPVLSEPDLNKPPLKEKALEDIVVLKPAPGGKRRTYQELLIENLGCMLAALKSEDMSAGDYFKKYPSSFSDLNLYLRSLGKDRVEDTQVALSKLMKEHFSEENAKFMDRKLAPQFEIAKNNEATREKKKKEKELIESKIEKSKVNFQILLSGIAEFTEFNEKKLPGSLEELRKTLGAHFDDFIVCPFTNKKYVYTKAAEKITDIDKQDLGKIKVLESTFPDGKIIGYLNYRIDIYIEGKLTHPLRFENF